MNFMNIFLAVIDFTYNLLILEVLFWRSKIFVLLHCVYVNIIDPSDHKHNTECSEMFHRAYAVDTFVHHFIFVSVNTGFV